jgi:hypothetical protein
MIIVEEADPASNLNKLKINKVDINKKKYLVDFCIS